MKITRLGKITALSFILIVAAFITLTLSYMYERGATENYTVFRQLGLELTAASDFLTAQAQQYVQYGEKKYYDAYWDEINNKKNRERVVNDLKFHGAPQNELALAEKAARLSNTLAELEDRAFKAAERGDLALARQLMFGAEYDEGKIPIIETMEEFHDAIEARTQKAIVSAKLLSDLCIIIFAVLIVSTAAVIIISFMKISGELKKITDTLGEVTSGIQSASARLNESAERLARGSSEQAASIEETSAAMNETAAMISENAEKTDFAARLARKSKDGANNSKNKMQNMVDSMKQLKESSGAISKIIKIINDIAFQTNLLAINATVESARAGGDAGRCFSAVAEEVRNLAQKSAAAASDTTGIIEKNIVLANNSSGVSHEVGEELNTIISEFNELYNIVNEINKSSGEQSDGVRQINTTVSQMEKTTQENAAIAQESYASANDLLASFDILSDAVSRLAKMV